MSTNTVPIPYRTLVGIQAAVNRLQALAFYIDTELVPQLDEWIDRQLRVDELPDEYREQFKEEFWRCAVAREAA